MRLACIPKHLAGRACAQLLTPLDALEAAAMCRWWDGAASASDHDAVLATLDRLHAGSAWLACGCTRDPANPPLLAVARRSLRHGGRLSLRRLTDRAAHRPDCRFAFDRHDALDDAPYDIDAQDAEDPCETGEPREPERPDFLFPHATRAPSPRADVEAARAPVGARVATHPLARRLFWLLHAAAVNRWPKPHVSSDRSAVLDLAEGVELVQGLWLRDVLYCDQRAWTQRWMDAGFRKCEAHGLKPQVWWLTEIANASQKDRRVRLVGAGDDTEIEGRFAVFGGDGATVRYPMLMCALVGQRPDGTAHIRQAYAHPIQALDRWLPVDSDLEREAVRDLQGVMEWLHRAKGVDLEMRKPLFPWHASGARPDFVLSCPAAPGERMVVETMGTDDAAYRDRKDRMRALLAGAFVFEDERARDPEGAPTHLRRAVARWALQACVRAD